MVQNLIKQLMENKLTIRELRKIIGETLGSELAKEDFILDSKLMTAKKKVEKKNLITIYFDCYDYSPRRIEFRLLFNFRISELDEETKKYYSYCAEDYQAGVSLSLSEGDFHPKVRHLDKKMRSAFTHVITNQQNLDENIKDCRGVLKEIIIPQLGKFSVLSKFQEFVFANYNLLIPLGITIQGLIAAKLHSKEKLKMLVDYLWRELDLESKSDLHLMRKLVTNIIPYSDETESMSN
jgi:hypothetical protein